MITPDPPPYTYAEPEDDSDIPRIVYKGWLRIRTYSRKVRVVHVTPVRFNGKLMSQIGPKRYVDGFPWPDIEEISEDEARAWLEEHQPMMPGQEG